jgi:hypothetical protein
MQEGKTQRHRAAEQGHDPSDHEKSRERAHVPTPRC